jgi:hypothetical protein
MIEIFLLTPIEIRIILLSGMVIFLIEFIKQYCNKENNEYKKK